MRSTTAEPEGWYSVFKPSGPFPSSVESVPVSRLVRAREKNERFEEDAVDPRLLDGSIVYARTRRWRGSENVK